MSSVTEQSRLSAQATYDETRDRVAHAREGQLTRTHRALLHVSGWLNSLAQKYDLDEDATRATLYHNGESLGSMTLREVLDLAAAALAPENHKDCSVTVPPENTDVNPS